MTTTAPEGVVYRLGYAVFDADNHYYEPEDAFLRYSSPELKHRAPRWVEMPGTGQRRLLFGEKMNRFVGADHTFNMVGRPGGLAQGLAGKVTQSRDNLEPARPTYRNRDARLALMDEQGLEGTLLFPTFAVSVETLVADDVDLAYATLHSFNQWLDDDWGFNYRDRIYGVPLLSLLEPYRAVEELEFVIGRGARVVNLNAGPIGGRMPTDRAYDPFWKQVAEHDITVVFHAADTTYRWEMSKVWGWGNINIPARNLPPLHRIIAGTDRSIHDMIATLIYGKLFERFPTLRMAAVELGCAWVTPLLEDFANYGKGDLDEDPAETFKRHFWVTPFESEDLQALAGQIGADRIMFGSDYPHTDGLADPVSFSDYLTGFDDTGVRQIMHDNVKGLVTPRR
jgi:predicted TIM-barrel fold metal-dependent hydrolase